MSVGSADEDTTTGPGSGGEITTPAHRHGDQPRRGTDRAPLTNAAAAARHEARDPRGDGEEGRVGSHDRLTDGPDPQDDDRDPLLVRPFLVPDGEPSEVSASAATWPADPSREIPTQVIPAVPAATPSRAGPSQAGPSPDRRRPLLLAGAGVAAVLAIVGWAVIRPALDPTVSTSLPDQQLPAITGPARTASSAPTSEAAAGGEADNSGGQADAAARPAPPATTASRSPAASSAAPRPTTRPTTESTTAVPGPPAELAPSLLEDNPKPLISGQGLCLDLRGGDVAEGAEVHVDDCNGSSPQQWSLTDDRALMVKDLCAYMRGDGRVELARCDGRTTAQWTLNEDGRLKNAANGRCLADPYFGGRPGNPVLVTFCTGTSNQRWSFR